MSFYLGKDNANNNILHITAGSTTEGTMRSGVQSNTVFHSDLPYLEVKEYNCTWDVGYNTCHIQPETAFITDYTSQGYFFVINNKYMLNTIAPQHCWVKNYNIPFIYDAYNDYRITPTLEYKYYKTGLMRVWGRLSSGITSVKAYLIKNLEYVNFIPFVPSTQSINMSSSVFNVRGKNLYNTIFLQSGKINNKDVVVYVDYEMENDFSVTPPGIVITLKSDSCFTLVNSRLTGSISIKSDYLGTFISRGGEIMFSSKAISKSKFLRREVQTPYYTSFDVTLNDTGFEGYTASNTIRTPYSGFAVGDLFCSPTMYSYNTPPKDTDKAPVLSKVFVYKNGDIGIFTSIYREVNSYFSIAVLYSFRGDDNGNLFIDCLIDVYKPYATLTRIVEQVQTQVTRFY